MSTPAEDALLKTTEERQHFQRLSRLLIVGGTLVLRDIFDNQHPPASLGSLLSQTHIENTLKKLTNPDQWKCLYPSAGVYGKSEDFDISLLSLLLRNICSLPPPTAGWIVMPADTDTSLSADITRIRMLRNQVYAHVNSDMEVTEPEFLDLWGKIRDALIRMAKSLSTTKEQEIDQATHALSTEPLSHEEKVMTEKLRLWYNQDMEVKDKLMRLEYGVNEIKSTVGQLKTLQENSKDGSQTCCKRHHEDKPLDHFCHDCREISCELCAKVTHRNHKVRRSDNDLELAKMREEISEEIKKAEEKLAEEDEHMETLTQRLLATGTRMEIIKKMLGNFVEKFIDKIKSQEQDILHEMEKLRHVAELDTEAAKKSIQKHQAETQQSVNYAHLLLEKGDVVEICNEAEAVKDILRQNSSFEVISKPCVSDRKTFSPNTKFFDELLVHGIGRIITVDNTKCSAYGNGVSSSAKLYLGIETMFTICTCTTTGEAIHAPYEGMSVVVRYRRDGIADYGISKQDVSGNVTDNHDGTYTASYIPMWTGIALVSVTIAGKHIPGSCFEVKIKPRKYRPIQTLGKKGKGLGNFIGPWCAAENSQGDIFVTDRDNDRVQVFNKEGSYVRTFGESGSGDGQLIKPRGIVIGQNGDVIVVDNGNNRIQIFDKHGQYKLQFGGYGSEDGCLSNPYSASTDGDGNLIITDTDNLRVQVFTPEGQLVRVFANTGEESIKRSCYCIQYEGQYIVSDSEDFSIKFYNKDGVYQHKINRRKGKFGKWLRGLAVDKIGNLLVCDSCEDRIQVFKPVGNSFEFLEKFGRVGEKLGQFKQPTTITVLRDGRFVVCEFHNSRVQIFE